MRALVVYYSRTGTTAKIAKEIAEGLRGDIEEIHDAKNRQGILRWFIAGKDGMEKNQTVIGETKHDPSEYDLIVVGTPIWVNATPAIRTYLKQNTGRFKKLAFFCTMGGSGGKPVFEEMQAITGKEPVAVMELRQKDVFSENYQPALRKFVSDILT